MLLKSATSLAFAAAALAAVAATPAGAQMAADPGDTSPNWSARQNVIESQHYDQLLQTNRAFREARMRKECGPITDQQLRQSCLASFAQYEPVAPSAASPTGQASRRQPTPNVGSSTAPRQHQPRSGQ
jgi:hypothetical protein